MHADVEQFLRNSRNAQLGSHHQIFAMTALVEQVARKKNQMSAPEECSACMHGLSEHPLDMSCSAQLGVDKKA